MGTITIVNISGQLVQSRLNPIVTTSHWIGKLISTGHNRYGIVAGNDIIILAEMPDYSEDFDRRNQHAVATHEKETLFVFGTNGGVIRVKDGALLVTNDDVMYFGDISKHFSVIKGYLANDYEVMEPKTNSNTESFFINYLKSAV